jgi:hypothetical protein
MLATLWSGFFIGYYKREGKLPEISLPKIDTTKPEKLTKEKAKENVFLS